MSSPGLKTRAFFYGVALLFLPFGGRGQTPVAASASVIGVSVHYQLPTDGPLPRTYRVTLAATDPKDPAWIIGTFAAGVVRTVTAENQGKFTETWDGLDDNYMPVPPGTYALKGIYMAVDMWPIDGQYHSIVPKLASSGGSWGQSPAEDTLPGKIEGDPVGAPLDDVDIAADGKGSVCFQYLENGTNYFLTDFTKPINYDQIITGYSSGVFAGGSSTCTDGKATWSFSVDGGVKFIGRADGQPFGHQHANRDHVYLPDGWVTALAAWPDATQGRTVVFEAERGKILHDSDESTTKPVDRIRALDGRDASILAEWKVERPLGLAARGNRLYILHGTGSRYEILSLRLQPGWEKSTPSRLFAVPPEIHPFDIEVDSHGRIYLSDSNANHVYQFDSQGRRLRTYGRLAAQKDGAYDPLTFMAPEKLACWTDAQGQDRLMVVEQAGPNRLSEWSGDSGELLRQWVIPQTKANDGYTIDPVHPDVAYVPGQRDTLIRWKIDYTTGQWTPTAVWTQGAFGGKLAQKMALPRIIYRGDDVYLAYGRGYMLYHLEGDRWRACAGLLSQHVGEENRYYLWRDLNADGQVESDEYIPFPTTPPPGTLRYFGETWFDDLSLVCMGQGTNDIWRLTPPRFDRQGTPIFDPRGWKKLLTDEIFVARQKGRAIALRGGNEVGNTFNSDWASVTKAANGDLYVSARSGPDFSANQGSQFKLSRYVSDGHGGYRQRWRVGRTAIEGNATPGQVYGPIYVSPPLNGLVGVIDNSRAGILLYTEDGLYVDTLFPDDHLVPHDQMGAYWQPGEFFAGYAYANRDNGKIYLAMGKTMPQIYEARHWTVTENPVHPLASLDASVALTADKIASPPAAALRVRGGAAEARVAQFYPSPGGGPALDGSMRGWEACNAVQFHSGPSQTVEVRCLYDPDHLYLRWKVRLGHPFDIKPLLLPQHIFAHGRGDDTFGLYLQGDPKAPPGGSAPGGRPGDVRFVFGIFKDNGAPHAVVLGMYPAWPRPDATPQTYTTPVGSVTFAHVALIPHATTGYQIDADGQGFVLAAAIPRVAIPGSPHLDGWRTEGNFDANLGGLNRFWWSNTDGSASRDTYDEPTEARLYPGSWSTVENVPIAPLPLRSWMAIGPFGSPSINRLDVQSDRDQIVKILFHSIFPPDTTRDLSAIYDGEQTHTRAAQRKLAWREVELDTDQVDLEKTLHWVLNDDEGTAYLLTHIYSPEAAQVTLHVSNFDGQGATGGQLNGKPLPTITDQEQPWIKLDASQPLSLQPGWNELLIRRDFIWGDPTLEASLDADPAILWKLRISGPVASGK